ncbi:MAG: hypothetical protein JEY94_08340 [Melioribacteraceae bacterium]|nr:hypothetical protein [Melioribacteraceae bacterium]
MNLRKLFYLMLIIPILFLNTACSDDDGDDPVEVNEAEVLVKYLEAGDDFLNTAAPAMIKSSDVLPNVDNTNWTIIDIRSASDFANGHIKNAVNKTTGELLSYYETNNLSSKEKVVIACYTGQTAGWATSLLRIMGYANVYDLKWGMSSWNPATKGSWVNTVAGGNGKAGQLVTAATAKAAKGDLPKLKTGETEAEDILRARVEAVFAEGFGAAAVGNGDVFGALSNYYIVNYWSEDHYNMMHIPGAVQYTPKAALKLDADLKTLPTDKPVAVYCYTGQTSAHVAAILKVIGYDAKSIKFGVNAMSYDAMPGTRFIESTDVHDYALVK